MVLPGSMNIAPPPETRRTTSMPCRCAPSGSTSLRTDWNEPMTTSGLSQSQKRSVGGRSPDATSRAMTSSRATCRAGSSTRAGMTSKAWSSHPVALPRARRIAMPIDSAVKPMSDTSSARAPGDGAGQLLDTGVDGHARQRRVDVAERLVGLEEEVARHADAARACPSTSSRSTATSLPPGTLYSPRMPATTPRTACVCRVLPSAAATPCARPSPCARCHAPSNHGSLATT